jgi:hypothetical protein
MHPVGVRRGHEVARLLDRDPLQHVFERRPPRRDQAGLRGLGALEERGRRVLRPLLDDRPLLRHDRRVERLPVSRGRTGDVDREPRDLEDVEAGVPEAGRRAVDDVVLGQEVRHRRRVGHVLRFEQ